MQKIVSSIFGTGTARALFARPRESMAWRAKREKDMEKALHGPTMSHEPVHLQFVVSSNGSEPWGIGFSKGIVNMDVKAKVAKLQSPADNFTWILKWYAELNIWASFKIPGDRGYCSLEEFLQSDGVAALWNNASLVASWTFVKDRVDGEEMSEDVAINLAALFPAEPSEEPVTPQSGSKRRAFSASPAGFAGSSSQSNTTKARRRCVGSGQLLDSLAMQSRRKPCAAEKRSMTHFACLCNTADWAEVPKFGRRKHRGWLVRFRVAREHRAAADNILCSFDASYCIRRHIRKQRVVWNQSRHEAWAWLACEQHGIDFVTQLLRDKRITDHNIQDE